MKTQSHRRGALDNVGHLHWSILGGLLTVRMPWSDLLNSDGRLDLPRVWRTLREFECELADTDKSASTVLPTANARFVTVDNGPFEAELAERLTAYKSRIRADRTESSDA